MIKNSYLITRTVPPCRYCEEPKRLVRDGQLQIKIVDVSDGDDQAVLNDIYRKGILRGPTTFPTLVTEYEDGNVKVLTESIDMTPELLAERQRGC